MKKVFLDTNVILDLLLDREPYNGDVAEIFDSAKEQSIQLCVASISIINIDYIIRKISGKTEAGLKIKKICKMVNIENVGQNAIISSINSDFNDFEDGIQNFCAEDANHSVIVTRNIKDFKTSKLSILSPAEFLAKIRMGLK